MGDGSSAKVDHADTGSRSRRRCAAIEKLPTHNCGRDTCIILSAMGWNTALLIVVDGGRWTYGVQVIHVTTPIIVWGTVYLVDSIWGTFGVQIKIPNIFPPIIVRQ